MIVAGGVVGRSVRAAALTALALGVSGLAHSAGGMPLSLPGVLVALCALGPVTWAVSASRLRLGRLVVVLGAGQALAHISFLIAHGTSAASALSHAAAPMSGLSGPALSGTALSGKALSGTAHGGHVAALSGPALLPSGRMLLAHGVATVVLALLLAGGEAVLWRVLGALTRLPAAVSVPPFARLSGVPDRLHIAPPALWADARAMRGPPGRVTA
ncbi:MAG: hypothetical protein LCH82_06355 [Actinobacteria bacterium]|nr:hypothetical protein [Actinomycetota bacterium]